MKGAGPLDWHTVDRFVLLGVTNPVAADVLGAKEGRSVGFIARTHRAVRGREANTTVALGHSARATRPEDDFRPLIRPRPFIRPLGFLKSAPVHSVGCVKPATTYRFEADTRGSPRVRDHGSGTPRKGHFVPADSRSLRHVQGPRPWGMLPQQHDSAS